MRDISFVVAPSPIMLFLSRRISSACSATTSFNEKLFGVSDMHPDVRPRDIHRQTIGVRVMMRQGGKAESQIKAVIEAWADAVRRRDLSGILAHDVRPPAAAAVARNGRVQENMGPVLQVQQPV